MGEEPLDLVEAFLEECAAEREQVETHQKELEYQVRQISEDVEKLSRRNAELANRVRQMESDFDTFPRNDIPGIYGAQFKEQGRLLMMSGQLEKLKAEQENLEQRKDLLARTIDILRSVGPTSVGSAASETSFTPEQSMIVRIIEAQEAERQRLSRQMHDKPAQLLTNVILQAEICQRLLDTDPPRARAELQNLKEMVNKTFQETRTFISELRPMMLDDLGLVPTLKRYVTSWSEKTGIKAELSTAGKPHRLAQYSEVTIFRAIQELLRNAEQHANPSHVQVTLDMDGQVARAVVEDDGIGFDIDEMMAAARARKTIGIAAIMDQVQMLGGSLNFDSARGRGTKAILQVPEN